MEGLAFVGTSDEWRRIAHKVADAIYERVTGEKGYFDTSIVYVSQVGPAKSRTKRLAMMDQDGAGNRFLTSGQSIVLTPRFAPNLQQITYLDFISGKPKVWLMNVHTQKKQIVGNFPGMTFAPRFSPDGSAMVMSFSKEGNTSLYSIDLASKRIDRLTNDPVIDTSPSYSPDGSQICFNSDRSGKTQIYIMNKDGSNVRRISFGDGSYRTPIWSPRGDLIAFTKITDGYFYIGVMRTDGSGERLLSKGWVVEDPCWSPNGRVLMFTRHENNGRTKIYTIDITGYNERLVETPTDAAGASWSPLRED
jgi:TolB protein